MGRMRHIKSVCICGSFRFYDEMVQLRNALQARGVICEWPMPGPRRAPQDMTTDEAREAITRHLERMDRAELIFLFNKGGYTGDSVVMEIGYAYAQRKPVYMLAPIQDPFLSSLVTAVVSIEELLHLVCPWQRELGVAASGLAQHLEMRLASEADLEGLVRLAVAFRDHLGQSTPSEADLRASIARLLQDAGTEFFLACGARGTPLGYVQARYRYSAWTCALEAELEDVFVLREARRCGVGLRLVTFAITRATARGCRAIGLNTNERNTEAVALYQRLGLRAERQRWQGGRQLWLTRSLLPG